MQRPGFDEQPSQSEVIPTPAKHMLGLHAPSSCTRSPQRIAAPLSLLSRRSPPLPVNRGSLPGEFVPVRRMRRFAGRWRHPSNNPSFALLPFPKKKVLQWAGPGQDAESCCLLNRVEGEKTGNITGKNDTRCVANRL